MTTAKMKNDIKKYYDKRSACQVLGSLMTNPKLLDKVNCPVQIEDFITPKHKAIFGCIYNLKNQGVSEINLTDIENYMHTYKPTDYIHMFEKNDSRGWINDIIEDANVDNYDYYYNTLKKMSILRSYMESGVKVSDILDMDEIDGVAQQRQLEEFESLSLNEIILHFDRKNMSVKKRFIFTNEEDSKKAGDGAKELREEMKESPSYGFSLESDYINTVTHGALPDRFFLETRDSGMGKTRVALKRLLMITAPQYWDFETEQFIDNPNGKNNSGLYIGTEMDLHLELEPIMWGIISGVEEDKITDNNLTDEENKRIDKAIEILENTKLYMVNEPNYGITYLWNIIEQYKIDYNISVVALDYIELTNGLVNDFIEQNKSMTVREDLVLLNLSKNIKEICKKFRITFYAFTQTTDEARRDGIRDQRAVKGARSLPNKADVGMVTFEPTVKELKLLEPVIHKLVTGKVKHKEPNVCYSFYKNRNGKLKKVRVWGWQNLGNMEYYDLFCTDENFKPISIVPTHIEMSE